MSTTGDTSGTGSLQPLTPVSGLGYLQIQGLKLSYATTTTFTVGQGQCRDKTNIFDIIMGGDRYSWANQSNPQQAPEISNAVTVNIGINGAGGLDVGTIAASTMYYVYAIGCSTGDLPGSVIISLSATAPTLPSVVGTNGSVASYDCYRYIGSISIDGSSHIRPFFQSGTSNVRPMRYQTAVAPASAATAGSTTYATIGVITTLIPQNYVDVLVDVSITPNAANNAVFLAPYGNTSSGDVTRLSGAATGSAQLGQLVCPCNLNGGTPAIMEVDYKTSSASDVVAFLVAGYIDYL